MEPDINPLARRWPSHCSKDEVPHRKEIRKIDVRVARCIRMMQAMVLGVIHQALEAWFKSQIHVRYLMIEGEDEGHGCADAGGSAKDDPDERV
nr:hypothetical protein [Pandoraea cepalis]